MSKSGGVLSVALAFVVVSSIVVFAFRAGSDDGWWQVATGSLPIVGFVVVLNAIAYLWAKKPRARAAWLRAERPGSIVLQSARIGGLQSFLKFDGAIDPVFYVTAVVEPAGISFWRDYSPPQVWSSVDAGEIRALEVETFVESSRTRHRLKVTTQNGDLMLPVLGEGLVGMMSPSRTEVESVAGTARAMLKRDC